MPNWLHPSGVTRRAERLAKAASSKQLLKVKISTAGAEVAPFGLQSLAVEGARQFYARSGSEPLERRIRQSCGNSRGEIWSGWPDSNRRPPDPQSGALPRLRYIPI